MRDLLVRADSLLSLLWYRYVPPDRKGDVSLSLDVERTISELRNASAVVTEAGLSLSIQQDPLAISMVLDDQLKRIELYEGVLLGIRKALGEDGLHAQLQDLPAVVQALRDAKA